MKSIFLVADVGGTNTSIALIEHSCKEAMNLNPNQLATKTSIQEAQPQLRIIALEMFQTKKLNNFYEALSQALRAFQVTPEQISGTCFGVAGPVKNGFAEASNIDWKISAKDIKHIFGLEVHLINDFTAISYGIPLIDVDDRSKITPLPHPNGSMPSPQNVQPAVTAILGAGTGLGMGFIVSIQGGVYAFASEGGHADFAPHNKETINITRNLMDKSEFPICIEDCVSGNGIANIFSYLSSRDNSDFIRSIAEGDNIPAEVSKNALQNPICQKTMHIFVESYARAAQNLALTLIPGQGLFLAGGIAAKNKEFFLQDNRFMRTFLRNGAKSIVPLLHEIPVYILEDYQTSLYGAAHVLVQQMKTANKLY